MESSVHTAKPSAHVQLVATAPLSTYVCARRKQYSSPEQIYILQTSKPPTTPRANTSRITETNLANKYTRLFATASSLMSSGIPIDVLTDCIALIKWTWT